MASKKVILTQKSALFFIRDQDGATPVRLKNVESISGISATRDQLPITDLDSDAHEYISGLAEGGTATIALNFNPNEDSHAELYESYLNGETVEFALGWSDGTNEPATLEGAFVMPSEDRSFLVFDGNVTDCPFDFSTNSVVKLPVSVKLSGFPTLHVKAPATVGGE